MRTGFLIAGNTFSVKDYLQENNWRWIADIKCYAKLSGLCDKKNTDEIREEAVNICKRFVGAKLQWKEVEGEQILKFFPKEFNKELNNVMPYSISEEIVGQRQYDDTLEATYPVGTKIWLFSVEFNDSALVRETNSQMYLELKNENYKQIKKNKFTWHGGMKVWITSGEVAKNRLEEKLQRKYEAYVMDKLLAKAFEGV